MTLVRTCFIVCAVALGAAGVANAAGLQPAAGLSTPLAPFFAVRAAPNSDARLSAPRSAAWEAARQERLAARAGREPELNALALVGIVALLQADHAPIR